MMDMHTRTIFGSGNSDMAYSTFSATVTITKSKMLTENRRVISLSNTVLVRKNTTKNRIFATSIKLFWIKSYAIGIPLSFVLLCKL